MKRKTNVLMLAEGGMMIALSILLGYIEIYQMPNGGSVSAGKMIPIIIYSLRWGVLPGISVGAIYGILDFILKPFFFHPIQLLLDYPIAFGILGIAGFAKIRSDQKNGYFPMILWTTLAVLGRLISHVISGVVFFSEYAGSQNPIVYSFIYNATYLVPELIISLIVLIIIWKPLKNYIVNNRQR
ncbi:energy-coupled thiamine transporter ThiT [Soehngenia longivitae]|uniref:Energy-coupled thiamine transporter ThiT n=1 Tax=Soehngenia longivitae TaxID=2562294 RepID=A0A4Z0D2M6_9FIRM|nr:energy-coupled thiamine transporter ThiT [Soehngenia longivitae]TFZ39578.1 energy-coupled thiamine transporter ThiT [Soehngenia longivitae]